MADPSRREVRNKLLALAHDAQWHRWERATIGALNSAGQQVVHAPGRPGWVYVSIERGDKLTATIALNSRVRPVYGMKVWVGANTDGLLAIMGIRETEVVEELGTQAAAATLPEVVTKGLIPARRMQPGLVVALPQGTSYTMSVYVYPFIYVYQGELHAWQGGWIDLTSHVPTSGAMRHWTLVCLDPETNTLSAIDGDDYGIPVTLTVDQLDDIDPGGAIPLAGVNLFYGMTAIDNENLFLDARPFLTGPGYNPISALRHNNTATVAPTATDDSADGYGRGSMWVDQTAGKIYICFDPTVGAAQWQEVGAGGAASASYDEFIDLIDTPDSFGGAGGKLIAVKATEDGLEFISASGITVYAEVVLFDVTLGADGNFDFQNIPQDYDHLKVYFFGQCSSTAGSGGVYLNNDTTETNYRTSLHRSGGNHTNALNNNAGLLMTPSISYFDGNIWCKATIEIPNYRATSYKVLYARMVQFDLDAGPVFAWHDYYINSMVHKGGTAAINRLTITQGATGWLAGSRCVVVGVGPLQLLAAT